MIKILKRGPVWRLMLSATLTIGLFIGTDAAKASSFVIILSFILLITTIYYLIYCILGFLKLYGINIKHQKTISIYVTIASGILIALQSIGELGSRDIIVLLPLAILGYFYSSYAKTITP